MGDFSERNRLISGSDFPSINRPVPQYLLKISAEVIKTVLKMRQELRRAKRAGCCGMGQGVGFPWELGLLHSLQEPFPSAEWGSGRCSSTSTAGRALGEELSGHLCVPSTPAAPIPAKSFQHLSFPGSSLQSICAQAGDSMEEMQSCAGDSECYPNKSAPAHRGSVLHLAFFHQEKHLLWETKE